MPAPERRGRISFVQQSVLKGKFGEKCFFNRNELLRRGHAVGGSLEYTLCSLPLKT